MPIKGKGWQNVNFLCDMCECFHKMQLAALHLSFCSSMFIIPVAKIHIITISILLWEFYWASFVPHQQNSCVFKLKCPFIVSNIVRKKRGSYLWLSLKEKIYSHALGRWGDCFFIWSSRTTHAKPLWSQHSCRTHSPYQFCLFSLLPSLYGFTFNTYEMQFLPWFRESVFQWYRISPNGDRFS